MIAFDEFENFDLLASVKLIESKFGGRKSPVFDGYRGQFFWHINHIQNADWDAVYVFPSGQVSPGEEAECKIVLSGNLKSAAGGNFKINDQFCIREGSKVIAVGIILHSNIAN